MTKALRTRRKTRRRFNILERSGIDLVDAMERFDGSRALHKHPDVKFLNDPRFDTLETAMASGDAEEAYYRIHNALKVSVDNLSSERPLRCSISSGRGPHRLRRETARA